MTIQDAGTHALSKITSGRWLCTVAVTLVFVYCAATGVLSQQEISDTVKMVFMFYFLKPPTEKA